MSSSVGCACFFQRGQTCPAARFQRPQSPHQQWLLCLLFCKSRNPKTDFGACQFTFKAKKTKNNPVPHTAAAERSGPHLSSWLLMELTFQAACGHPRTSHRGSVVSHQSVALLHTQGAPGLVLHSESSAKTRPGPLRACPRWPSPLPPPSLPSRCPLAPLSWRPPSTRHVAVMASAGSLLILAPPAPFSCLPGAMLHTGLS